MSQESKIDELLEIRATSAPPRGAAEQADGADGPVPHGVENGLMTRYRDAYSIGRGTVAVGGAIKVVGMILGVVGALAAFSAFKPLGTGGGIGLLLLALAFGGAIYALGILISANGQLLLATLDSAVNSSPLLSNEQKAAIIRA